MNKDFVNNIQKGNNIEAQNIFKQEIADKVGSALELKRKELSQTFVKTEVGNVEDEV